MDAKENIINFNNEIVGIDTKVQISNGDYVKAINFDNAATTPALKCVIENIVKNIDIYGSIGRGAGYKAEMTTKIYNECREYLLEYFNIFDKDLYTVIYVNNTTDGINKLAKALIKDKNDIVISTRMEHHSNDLPWRRNCKVDYIEVDQLGRLDLSELENKLIYHSGKVEYITVTGASNVTGYLNDIHKIARIAHKYNAKLIVDGAQLVPHFKVNMSGNSEEEKIDFLVFSAHKLYAPFGGGAIIGPKAIFDASLPFNEGGGTVNLVLDNQVKYLNSPEKDEAGTPNFFGVLAMVTALQRLDNMGFQNIRKNEVVLKKNLMEGLKSINGIINYGDKTNIKDSLGIVVFNVKDMHHEEASKLLSLDYGISVRQGCFCAHPYCNRLLSLSEKELEKIINDTGRIPGMIRVSLGMYNNKKEVEYFLEAVEKISLKNGR